jgi:hypothetical protein
MSKRKVPRRPQGRASVSCSCSSAGAGSGVAC